MNKVLKVLYPVASVAEWSKAQASDHSPFTNARGVGSCGGS